MYGEIKEELVVTNTGEVKTVPVQIKDRNKAAELLGKSYRIYTDKVELQELVPLMIVGDVKKVSLPELVDQMNKKYWTERFIKEEKRGYDLTKDKFRKQVF